ncbi:MAG TPA: hypothetical protein VI322_00645 [Candidatus Saccharimonadia bacterium]
MMDRNFMYRSLQAISFTGFIFGMAGWFYIAENAVFHPETLSLPLTHLAPVPREDTFGVICFGVSVVCCLIWSYMRSGHRST